MCDLQIGRDDRRIHVEKSDAQRDPLLRFLRKPIPDGTEPRRKDAEQNKNKNDG